MWAGWTRTNSCADGPYHGPYQTGGEWTGSIELENIAAGHADVAEAAAIEVPDPKWGKRPLLIVMPRPGCAPTEAAVRASSVGKVPSWSMPDRLVVAESLPDGATGKVLKTERRRLYAAGYGPTAP